MFEIQMVRKNRNEIVFAVLATPAISIEPIANSVAI
jgi:hypothetical protein